MDRVAAVDILRRLAALSASMVTAAEAAIVVGEGGAKCALVKASWLKATGAAIGADAAALTTMLFGEPAAARGLEE